VATGVAFAGCLVAAAWWGRATADRPRVPPAQRKPHSQQTQWPPSAGALALGLGLGVLLLLPGAWLALHGYPTEGARAGVLTFTAWAPAITFVASSEEVLLRGVLQPRLARTHGDLTAILAVAAVFALMHIPLYGAVALPLDLGTGILIGVVRLRTGSVASCALAHAIADLGEWWVA